MPAPTQVEKDNLRHWSLFTHFQKQRPLYVWLGKAQLNSARTLITVVQKRSTNPISLTFSEDELAELLYAWLINYGKFNSYLSRKGHITTVLRATLTETFARHIAWDAYSDITS